MNEKKYDVAEFSIPSIETISNYQKNPIENNILNFYTSPSPIDLTMDLTPTKSNFLSSDPKDILGKEIIISVGKYESKLISLNQRND